MSFIDKYLGGDKGSVCFQNFKKHVITSQNNEQIMNGLKQSDVVILNTGETLTPALSLDKGRGSKVKEILNQVQNDNINNRNGLFTSHHSLFTRKYAFTLAEVLITLGIIGIVAAMTIPTLMTKYAKQRTETQLKAFYSRINQTLKMSAAENGDIDGLIEQRNYSYNDEVEFLKQYIFPYMKYLGYEDCTIDQTAVCVTLIDGGLMWFSVDANGGDIEYFPEARNRLEMKKQTNDKNLPRHKFQFQFAKYKSDSKHSVQSTDFLEPYIFNWDGTKEGLKKDIWACVKGCTNCGYCTKMIQMNDWKIPDDYPW